MKSAPAVYARHGPDMRRYIVYTINPHALWQHSKTQRKGRPYVKPTVAPVNAAYYSVLCELP
jgi:hypothetical protein